MVGNPADSNMPEGQHYKSADKVDGSGNFKILQDLTTFENRTVCGLEQAHGRAVLRVPAEGIRCLLV